MREQGQSPLRRLAHTFSSICYGSGTARNATWLRYQAGKRQVNERRTACEQAVIPFPFRKFASENQGKQRGTVFALRLANPRPDRWSVSDYSTDCPLARSFPIDTLYV